MKANPLSTEQANGAKRATAQPLHVVQIADALLTLRTAADVSSLSQATLRRKEKEDPTFPRLIKFGARCTRIRAGDLMKWLAAQGTTSPEVT